MVFFFFKQKTAYEMRISDWSSDVCSSDLPIAAAVGRKKAETAAPQIHADGGIRGGNRDGAFRIGRQVRFQCGPEPPGGGAVALPRRINHDRCAAQTFMGGHDGERSEEHTSELQSLMRISYSVICLKKKKTKK